MMKTKGIPFWEQHLEHFVLGLALIALIAFASMQFMGSPNAVDVPGAGKVGPAQIDNLLEAKAKTISQRITDAPIEIPKPTPVLSIYQSQQSASVAPSTTLALLQPNIGPVVEGMAGPADRPFVVATVPPVTGMMEQQYFDTLNPETVDEYSELKDYLPPATPFDKTWITVAATFDADAVLQQFSHAGSDGAAPLPQKWYNDRVDIVDVVAEREELSGNQWTNATTLKPIPGQITVRPLLLDHVDAAKRDQILALVGDPVSHLGLIQPEFYPGIAAAWAPPGKVDENHPANANEDPAITDLKNKISRTTKELERVKKRLDDSGCPPEAPPPPPKTPPGAPKPPPGRPGAGGGGGSEFGNAGGHKMRDPNSSTGKTPPSESTCRVLRAKIKTLTKQLESAQAELQKLTPEKPVEPTTQEAKPEEPAGKYQVWVHDLNVQPGKTYRYRILVKIYNPLFARKADLIAAQQAMADQFTLNSEASAWSEPIIAQPPLRLFVVQARPSGQTGGLATPFGSATIDVYRFRNGQWWHEHYGSVQPGQRIGDVKAPSRSGENKEGPIDFSTDWFVLDVVKDLACSDDDESRGWAANVLLQSLSEPGLTQTRSPRVDSQSPALQFLRQEVQSGDSDKSVASAK